MADYTLAVGTHDPSGFAADSVAEAVRRAADDILHRFPDDLRRNPEEVVTLLGPEGLVTRPGERVDEFLRRITSALPVGATETIQPGDTNTPDCNGD